MAIEPGYMGLAEIAGEVLPYSSASVHVKQDINTPDLVQGSWDRILWNWNGALVSGSISGPLTCEGGGGLWGWAFARGGVCGQTSEADVSVGYGCSSSLGFSCHAASLSISCSAGDVAQYSVNIIGIPVNTGVSPGALSSAQLATWDVCSATPATNDLASFEVSVENNPQPAYVVGSGSLVPDAIIDGIRTITASMSEYGLGNTAPVVTGCSDEEIFNVTFRAGGASGGFSAVAHPAVPQGSAGLFMSSVTYTAVGDQ